jgi:hypothetical protein
MRDVVRCSSIRHGFTTNDQLQVYCLLYFITLLLTVLQFSSPVVIHPVILVMLVALT